MKKFKKILCPYDFSEHSEEAVLYAVSFAKENTLIMLLHTIELPYHLEPNGLTYIEIDYDAYKKQAKDNLKMKMDDLHKLYPSFRFESKVVFDVNPVEVILDVEKSKKPDLIVMGSHGRRGLSRLLMGSVAESVFREAHCPVVLIKLKSKK